MLKLFYQFIKKINGYLRKSINIHIHHKKKSSFYIQIRFFDKEILIYFKGTKASITILFFSIIYKIHISILLFLSITV